MTSVKGGGKSTSQQACAACKYQRRRCAVGCPLAPYFPADRPRQFLNVHRLFGVSNVLKNLDQVDPSQKADTMETIIYQANMREREPVHGCLAVVTRLVAQIQQAELELATVKAHLDAFRHHRLQQLSLNSSAGSDLDSQLQLSVQPTTTTTTTTNNHHHHHHNSSSSGSNSNNNDHYESNFLSLYNDGIVVEEQNENNLNIVLWEEQQQLQHSAFMISPPLPPPPGIVHDNYDEISPYFENIAVDDEQSYVNSKEAYGATSEESLLRNTMQSGDHHNLPENELKTAAARFSLTSVN